MKTLVVITSILALAGCQSAANLSSQEPPSETPSSEAPSAASVPAGLIAYAIGTPGGKESYFTIRTDGTEQTSLFETEACGCLAWSPSGDEVWSVSETASGTLAMTTQKPDGSDRTVIEPPIAGLSLAGGVATPDGQTMVFTGWSEDDPTLEGLWVGSPDMSDARRVISYPDGVTAIEPLGITPDGRRILFFGEQGPEDYVTHAGAVFAVNADGTDLEQLSPEGLHVAMVRGRPASMSPDGSQVAFAAFEGHPDDALSAVYVVSIDGGPAERITEPIGGIWSTAWSPTRDEIAYAQWSDVGRLSVVRPDGSGQRDLTDPAFDQAGFGSWSPDGDYLVVGRGVDGYRNLWIMDRTGAWIGQVTHDLEDYAMYAWSPAMAEP